MYIKIYKIIYIFTSHLLFFNFKLMSFLLIRYNQVNIHHHNNYNYIKLLYMTDRKYQTIDPLIL
jgi:hypothetical protein